MGITLNAPRGGLLETLDRRDRILILRLSEIERFEDTHRGIFEVWDGFYGKGVTASAGEVQDLVALGLVGGGMSDADADALVRKDGASGLMRNRVLAQALLGIAFQPDALDDVDDPPGKTEAASDQGDTMSALTSAPQHQPHTAPNTSEQ